MSGSDFITAEARYYATVARATVKTPGAARRMCESQSVAWLAAARVHKANRPSPLSRGKAHRAMIEAVERARINARAARYLRMVDDIRTLADIVR